MINLNEKHKHRFHIDPNRPPLTHGEAVDLSQNIGSLKRARRTIATATQMISRYEDKGDKPSNSGVFINAGLKCLGTVMYWLDEAIAELESGRNYAKRGE